MANVYNVYTTDDLDATLERANIDRSTVHRVLAAYGRFDDFRFWAGGFLLWTRGKGKAPYLLLTGWCDSSGWGCQGGIEMTRFRHVRDVQRKLDRGFGRNRRREPSSHMFARNRTAEEPVVPAERWERVLPPWKDWDHDPIDLNRWLSKSDG